MEEKEKRKKPPKRKDKNEPNLNCDSCGIKVSPESPTLKKCNCHTVVCCSDRCKKKSDHFKSCRPLRDSEFSDYMPTIEFPDREILRGKCRGKSFDDLLKFAMCNYNFNKI